MKKLLAILLSALLTASLASGCASSGAVGVVGGTSSSAPASSASAPAASSAAADSAKEKLIVGLDDQFPPMGFRDEKGELTGFDVELAKKVGERLGMEVVLQPINWSAKEMELDSGNVSVLWNGMTITEERKNNMLVSPAYMNNAQIIVVKADSAIAGKADLKDKIVALQTGSSAEEAFNDDADLKNIVKNGAPVQMDDNVAALNDLEIGRVDAVVLDKIVADYYMSKKSGVYKMLSEELAPEEYGIAFKKGNQELHDKVCGEIQKMMDDGTAAEISKQWFGSDVLTFKFAK